MERARATWTDERWYDLSHRVEDGFNRVDGDLRHLRTEIIARFDAVNARFDALQRMIFQVFGATMVTILATLGSVLATRA